MVSYMHTYARAQTNTQPKRIHMDYLLIYAALALASLYFRQSFVIHCLMLVIERDIEVDRKRVGLRALQCV